LNQPTETAQLATGETYQETITLTGTGTLKATLVWMDPPSGIQNRKNLINDLDLTITKGGQTYYPNGGQAKDDTNNVEVIEVAQATGTFVVTVTAAAINANTQTQPYALVITGPFTAQTPPTPAPTPAPAPAPTPAPVTGGTTGGGNTEGGNAGGGGTVVQPVIITSGNCSDNDLASIRTVTGCQTAAVQLGIANPIPTEIYGDNRPEGCYTIGGRVYVATNPANDGNGVMGDRRPICRPTVELYRMLSSGTCQSNGLFGIYDPETCADAAAELRLGDISPASILSDGRPDGCYYKPLLPGNALFVPDAPGSGVSATQERQLICALSDPTVPPPAPDNGGNTGGNPFMGVVNGARLASLGDLYKLVMVVLAGCMPMWY